jgi:hypothetical protein
VRETECDVQLCGNAFDEKKAYRVCAVVKIKGEAHLLHQAVRCIEDRLLASLKSANPKRLFLHDVAAIAARRGERSRVNNHNRITLHRVILPSGGVSEEEKFTCVLTLNNKDGHCKKKMAIIRGRECKGVKEIVGDTDCLVHIFMTLDERGIIYIESGLEVAVAACRDRAVKRINLAFHIAGDKAYDENSDAQALTRTRTRGRGRGRRSTEEN